MKNYYKPTDIHLVRSILLNESFSMRTFPFVDKDKSKIIEGYLSEEFDRVYPIFEEYHIPRGFDKVIDSIVIIIKQKLIEFRQKNYSDREIYANDIKYHIGDVKPTELLKFVYDSDKKECIQRNPEEDFDNTHEFPIILFFYETFGDPTSIERTTTNFNGKEITFVKFNVHLSSIEDEKKIKNYVRHEIVHIVERFSSEKDLREFNKDVNREVFDYLSRKYKYNDIVTGHNYITLFSETEMNARANELYEKILGMSNNKIEEITRTDYSIKIKGILELFKDNHSITLFNSMKAFIETIDECINGKEIPEYLKCFVYYNYKLRLFEYRGFLNDPEQFMSVDYLTNMAEYFDKIIKKFETKCYKIIYKALEDKGYYKQKSNFQRRLEESNIMPYLVFESQEIYYIVNIDNEF